MKLHVYRFDNLLEKVALHCTSLEWVGGPWSPRLSDRQIENDTVYLQYERNRSNGRNQKSLPSPVTFSVCKTFSKLFLTEALCLVMNGGVVRALEPRRRFRLGLASTPQGMFSNEALKIKKIRVLYQFICLWNKAILTAEDQNLSTKLVQFGVGCYAKEPSVELCFC